MSKNLEKYEERFVARANRVLPVGGHIDAKVIAKAKIIGWRVYDRMEACFPYSTPELGIVGQDYATEEEAEAEALRVNQKYHWFSDVAPEPKKKPVKPDYSSGDTMPTRKPKKAVKATPPPAAKKVEIPSAPKVDTSVIEEVADYGDLSAQADAYAKDV